MKNLNDIIDRFIDDSWKPLEHDDDIEYVSGHNDALRDLKSRKQELVEGIIEKIKGVSPREEYIDQLGALEMKMDIIKELTGE